MVPVDLPELSELTKQLKVLGVDYLQESAVSKIKDHTEAFRDGIIPNNLPKGFYINKDKKALCYTEVPESFLLH